MKFREAVDRLLQEMGVAMRELIPLLIKCRVTKSMIGTQVNNPLAHFYKLGNRFHG
jgi:hypothetical protein